MNLEVVLVLYLLIPEILLEWRIKSIKISGHFNQGFLVKTVKLYKNINEILSGFSDRIAIFNDDSKRVLPIKKLTFIIHKPHPLTLLYSALMAFSLEFNLSNFDTQLTIYVANKEYVL